jgi:non-ribosomal peptide synthase protein (TIGR01720 family)
MPVTRNGKVDRKRLPGGWRREEEEGGGGERRERREVEEVLSRIWGEVLGREGVGLEENFFEAGGDSILSIQVVGRAREQGWEITPKQMFERPTVGELAEVARRSRGEEREQGAVKGKVELTPIQRAFFSWGLEREEHYNQSVLLEVKEEVSGEELEKAVRELVRQHDAMRMRYRKEEGGEWEQWCVEEEEMGEWVYERRDLRGCGEQEWEKEMERDEERVQGSLDLGRGRVVRAVEYELGEKRGRRLLLVAHHLVVDGVSWRILLEDLNRACRQLRRGERVDLGGKSSSYQEWGKRLVEYGESAEVRGEVEYWRRQGEQSWETGELPREGEGEGGEGGERNLVGMQERVVVWLEEEETRELLQQVPEVYHTQVNDVLLTALWRVMAEWSGGERVLVDVEGHGREEVMEGVDVSRTVGWFTTIYPVVLGGSRGWGEGWDIGGELKRIKEQLRGVPRHGLGYGLLRYGKGEKREGMRPRLEAGREAELRFNYLGQIDQVGELEWVKLARGRGGHDVAGENRRRYLVDVTAMVREGRMRVQWSYSGKLERREAVERVAGRYVESLRQILEHCRSAEAGGYTPSDFPLANLRDEDFKQIAAMLEESA